MKYHLFLFCLALSRPTKTASGESSRALQKRGVQQELLAFRKRMNFCLCCNCFNKNFLQIWNRVGLMNFAVPKLGILSFEKCETWCGYTKSFTHFSFTSRCQKWQHTQKTCLEKWGIFPCYLVTSNFLDYNSEKQTWIPKMLSLAKSNSHWKWQFLLSKSQAHRRTENTAS